MKKQKKWLKPLILALAALAVLAGAWLLLGERIAPRFSASAQSRVSIPDWIDVNLVGRGNPSRTGRKLEGPADIVVHYVGNPGTTALQNRNYFNNRDSDVSSHFVVGLDGEIILCIPLNERSAATGERNVDTISIEVCHPDESGQFTDASYASLQRLVAWLMQQYGLGSDHVIRHYDVTGKVCPKYFVDHPDAWEAFKAGLADVRP